MLKKHELQTLKAALVQRLHLLQRQIGEELAIEMTERYRDLAGEVTDAGDEAVGAEIAAIDNAIIGHNVDDVREIEGALARIADGTYGRCLDCGDPIGFPRLRAYSTSLRCVRCQALHEKTFAGGRHSSL
jgi:DnaK suppressor protein